MSFDQRLLHDLLRCPKSHRPLVWDTDTLTSTDPETRLQFAIIDDIPNMLIEEAKTLPVDEWRTIMQRHGIAESAAS
jgi:uncharacterized protein YbaR (Trm112 family)